MIGVLIYHDRIGIPEPVSAIIIVGAGNGEVEIANLEAFSISSREAENMARPETSRESAVLKRVIDTIAGIIPPGIMSDPLVIGVDVGRVGVSRPIRKTPAVRRGGSLRLRGPLRAGRFLGSRGLLDSCGRRTMGGHVASTHGMTSSAPFLIALLLRPNWRGQR